MSARGAVACSGALQLSCSRGNGVVLQPHCQRHRAARSSKLSHGLTSAGNFAAPKLSGAIPAASRTRCGERAFGCLRALRSRGHLWLPEKARRCAPDPQFCRCQCGFGSARQQQQICRMRIRPWTVAGGSSREIAQKDRSFCWPARSSDCGASIFSAALCGHAQQARRG